MPPALKYVGIGLGVVVAGALAVWLLLFNGLNVVFSKLPPGMVKLIGEKPGNTRVMPVTAERAPWESEAEYAKRKAGRGSAGVTAGEPEEDVEEAAMAAQGKVEAGQGKGATGQRKAKAGGAAEEPDEAAEEPAAPVKTDEQAAAEAAMAPIRVVAGQADEAIAEFQDDPENQGLYLAANAKIEAIKKVPIEAETDALRTAAAEFVKDAVLQRHKLLQDSRKAGRATHRVLAVKSMPFIGMRKAASATSDFGGHLTAGQLVRVHIDAGGGWVRIEVLTGDNVGTYGYARSKYLIALKTKTKK